METKQCSRCLEVLSITDFYKKSGKSYPMAWCKTCHKKAVAETKDKARERVRRRGYYREYWKRNHDKMKEIAKLASRKRRAKKCPKLRARQKLYYAIRRGYVIRPASCDRCGIACKPEAHHHDYSNPLDVVWLCRECHTTEHWGEFPGLNDKQSQPTRTLEA